MEETEQKQKNVLTKEAIRPLGYTAPVRILTHLAIVEDGDWLNSIARETELAVSTTAEALDRLETEGWVKSEYVKTKRIYKFNKPTWYDDVFKVQPIQLLEMI